MSQYSLGKLIEKLPVKMMMNLTNNDTSTNLLQTLNIESREEKKSHCHLQHKLIKCQNRLTTKHDRNYLLSFSAAFPFISTLCSFTKLSHIS